MKKTIVLCFLLTVCISGFSQTNDAQLWENIFLYKKLSDKFTVTMNHEGRIRDNVSQFNYAYLDFGFATKLTKHLKVSIDYLPLWRNTDTRISWTHQYYFLAFYKVKFFKRFEVGLREMYQQQYRDIYSSDNGTIPQNYLRSKLVMKYFPFYFPYNKFTPYYAGELYYNLDNNNKYGPQFDRIRNFLGLFYSFDKRTDVELYYMIERNFNINDPPTNYVIGIGFAREL